MINTSIYFHDVFEDFKTLVTAYCNLRSMILQKVEDSNLKEDSEEESIELILAFIKQNGLLENRGKFHQLLKTIKNIISSRPKSINFLQKILFSFISDIKEKFSPIEVYDIFAQQYSTILFFVEKEIIDIETITKYCGGSDLRLGRHLSMYFFPEIKDHDNEFFDMCIECHQLQEEMKEYINNEEEFKKSRRLFHSDNKIAQIIRKDDLDSFQTIISSTNCSYKDTIPYSLFEDDAFLDYPEPTMIEYAAFFGSIEIFKFLWLSYQSNNQQEIPVSIFSFAIIGGNREIFHIAEEKFKNKINENCYILLSTAVEYNREDFFDYLVSNYLINSSFDNSTIKLSSDFVLRGINVKENYYLNSEILGSCLRSYNYNLLIKMIEYNPGIVNIQADYNYSNFFYSCDLGMVELVQFFLNISKNASQLINRKEGHYGQTPFYGACKNTNPEIIKILIEHKGVKFNIIDKV